MKNVFLFLLFMVSVVTITSAQILLDVEGDAKIDKRLILGNTTDYNMFIGYEAGMLNETGAYNTFLGVDAGRSNTIGNQNVFIGRLGGRNNTTGGSNVFIGSWAGANNTTGFHNTFLGQGAGTFTTISYSNLFIGVSAGIQNTIGNSNTCLGAFSDVMSSNLNNATAIGSSSSVDASNKVVIGNTSITVIGGYSNWMNLSDKRYKKNIKKEKNHLDFILQLSPVSYQYNTFKIVKEQQQQKAIARNKTSYSNQESDNTQISSREYEVALKNRNANELKAAEQKDKIRYSGFLAQDVEKVANKVGYGEFSGIVKPEINGGKYGLRYAEFVVPLVGAVQEQQTLIEAQQQQIIQRDQKIEKLSADVTELKEMMQTLLADQKIKTTESAVINNVHLGQNIPNPFTALTKIPYSIPSTTRQARIIVYTLNGQLIKSIAIQQFGEGTLELQTNDLNNGQYTYSLEIDGQVVETKKMSLQRK